MKLILILLFSIIFQIALPANASPITAASFSEISGFNAEWCSPNQIIAQDIQIVCVGSAKFDAVSSTRAIAIQRRDQTRELFIEKDFSSIDMMNLAFEVIGPVASSKPREKFAPKYSGALKLEVDQDGEVIAVSGSLRLLENFYATKP